MRTKYKITAIILIALAAALLPLQSVTADTGPKPSMDFYFVQSFAGPPLTITSGTLFECEQADCSDAQPLKKLGPQRFVCQVSDCGSAAYGYSRYHRIEISFSDGKTRRSNIFETAGFNSKYKVTIRPDDLLVEDPLIYFDPNSPMTYVYIALACICLLCVTVVGIVAVVLVMRRISRKQ